jgi:hypothetical protein
VTLVLVRPARATDYARQSLNLGGMEKVERTDEEWREQLSPAEYEVLRKAGTERAFTGEYTDTETTGVYKCRACGAELFRSDTKFHSGCGCSTSRSRGTRSR